ncbi:MAG: phosphodiesterase, partial [Maritimibacter sp.]|nr:phosphodiesterase [Maritimibacter sp.]
MTLPEAFLRRPIAHRALHGPDAPENSLSAVRAAVAAGYGIEIDVQPSADEVAMVFHDYDLDRLTETTGPVRIHSATWLESVRLKA